MRCAAAVLPIGILIAISSPAERRPGTVESPKPAARSPSAQTKPKLEHTIAAWLGTPYRYGHARKSGTDCSGFIRAIARETFAVDLPHSSRKLFQLGMPIPRKQLRRGDLVFFATGQKHRLNHVGIYMGRGRFVHASESRGVVYDRLDDYRRQYRGARRLAALR